MQSVIALLIVFISVETSLAELPVFNYRFIVLFDLGIPNFKSIQSLKVGKV